jgi:hypothetical protein
MVVEAGPTNLLAPQAEQELAALTALAVDDLGLRRPDVFPGVDELADDRVDRLGERPGGLVLRHPQQADRERLAGLLVATLVALDAVDVESADLVDAAPGEQPHSDQGANHLDRVVQASTACSGGLRRVGCRTR